MTEPNQDPVGDLDQEPVAQDPEPSNTVKYETYRKTLSEAKRAKAELEELRAWKEEQERLALESSGKKDELVEHWKSKAAETEAALKEKDNALALRSKQDEDSRKFSAFTDALPGKLARKYWGLVDLESIVVDEDGLPLADSVEKAVKAFNETYPEVLSKPNPHNINSPMPKGNDGKVGLTKAEWMKLPPSERSKRVSEISDAADWMKAPPDNYSVNGRHNVVQD